MAFEEVNTAGFKTYLTRYGVARLLDPTSNFDIKYFSLDDSGINYSITGTTGTLVTSVNGDDIKTLYNSTDDIEIIDGTPNTTNQGTTIAKREIVFIDDCNNLEYKNLDVTVYLGNHLQSLRDTLTNIDDVSRGYEPFIKLYDFINVNEYTENAFGEFSLWNTKNNNLNYVFHTDQDYNNYTLINNTFVSKNGGASSVNYDGNRFKTPFQLTASSYKSESTNKITQNGKFVIQLYPVNNITYKGDFSSVSPEGLTDAFLSGNKNVTPIVNFNGINHSLNLETSRVYKNNVNLPIFRFNSLLESGITSAKNMFEFYGTDSATDPNVKVITINMDVVISDSVTTEQSVRPAKLKLNLTLDLNEANWNASNPITNIN